MGHLGVRNWNDRRYKLLKLTIINMAKEKNIQVDRSPFRKISVSHYITITNSHHLNQCYVSKHAYYYLVQNEQCPTKFFLQTLHGFLPLPAICHSADCNYDEMKLNYSIGHCYSLVQHVPCLHVSSFPLRHIAVFISRVGCSLNVLFVN